MIILLDFLRFSEPGIYISTKQGANRKQKKNIRLKEGNNDTVMK